MRWQMSLAESKIIIQEPLLLPAWGLAILGRCPGVFHGAAFVWCSTWLHVGRLGRPPALAAGQSSSGRVPEAVSPATHPHTASPWPRHASTAFKWRP